MSMHPNLTVAIMSGRNRAEFQAKVGIPGLVHIGNQGLEISGDGFLFVEAAVAGYSAELSELGARLATKLEKIPGAMVEDKGLTILIDTLMLEDPKYLTQSFVRSAQYKKQSDASGWEPSPCSAK